jgi:hypothetical protein
MHCAVLGAGTWDGDDPLTKEFAEFHFGFSLQRSRFLVFHGV